MKKTFSIILAFVLGLNFANAQRLKDSEVPPLFKTNLAKLHPSVKVDKWEKEQNGYEASFHVGALETSVTLGPNGQLIQTEEEMAVTDLPKAVSDYIKANLAGKSAKEASKITDAKGIISYEAEIDNVDYIFDPAGTLLKKEVEKDDKDDHDKK